MEARSQTAPQAHKEGTTLLLSWLRPGKSNAAEVRKTAALRVTAGFERGHVLVLVHEEKLAVTEALGFAGLA
jgi:hypothetical protein